MLTPVEKLTGELQGKPFPCPVCQTVLQILLSVKQKPYCVCNACGIQIFFRGKAGIERLKRNLKHANSEARRCFNASQAAGFYNYLEKLRMEKSALEQKQGIFFRDQSLEDAIAAIDAEIRNVEIELKNIRRSAEKNK